MTNIISLTGDLGSGKSTVSAILCKRLGYDYIYTGKIQRKIAERYNMTTTELNKYSETHPEIDEEIDSTFKSLNNANNLVVDSRLAWFFIPNSFKVFMKTNLIISAERISKDKERKNEKYSSADEAAKGILERKESENKRYKELYGANCSNLTNFNLIIDTSFIQPEKVAQIIIEQYNTWQENKTNRTFAFISPRNLFPSKKTNSINFQNNYNLTDPILVCNINSLDYIVKGHQQVSAALKNNIDIISVSFENNTNQLINTTNEDILLDWENYHSFKFLRINR